MVISLELMVVDLQIQTDEAWIPLQIDNRNISLNSVAATRKKKTPRDLTSLSTNLILVYGTF